MSSPAPVSMSSYAQLKELMTLILLSALGNFFAIPNISVIVLASRSTAQHSTFKPVCFWVCAPCACLMSAEAGGRHPTPWDWSY